MLIKTVPTQKLIFNKTASLQQKIILKLHKFWITLVDMCTKTTIQ